MGGFLASRLSSMGATSSERGHASKEYIKSDKRGHLIAPSGLGGGGQTYYAFITYIHTHTHTHSHINLHIHLWDTHTNIYTY